jgi:hypothetical protein|tara:strand:- start:1317 stop:2228 length:912 start_codon:yes stop_codon:yes gene_type:complete
MKKVHFMYVPFTGLGLQAGYRGRRWLKNRIRVFKQFVVPSLVNQSKKEFVIWCSWREEDRGNKIIEELERSLQGIRGMTAVFTYGGLCFWDDKYEDEVAKQRLVTALQNTLPELESYIPEDTERVYMTIQPSDDMYLGHVVEEIQESEHIGVICYKQGYIINYANKEIADYDPTTNPPFFTIVFDRERFLNPQEHLDFTGPYKSHEDIIKHVKSITYKSDRAFVVGTHGENISTTYNHPYRGRLLSEEERDAVLIKTGTLFSDTVVVRRGYRLLARRVLNLLPFQDQIRYFYHNKLPLCLRLF